MNTSTAENGFTLVETLVSLVIISLLSTLIFQVIGHFSRTQGKLLTTGQETLETYRAETWFRESVGAATPAISDRDHPLSGDEMRFAFTTINALTEISGKPKVAFWQIEQTGFDETLVYGESGGRTWQVLKGLERGRSYLEYIDHEGASHSVWPPEEETGLLLAAVRFSTEKNDSRTERLNWYVFVETRGLGWAIDP